VHQVSFDLEMEEVQCNNHVQARCWQQRRIATQTMSRFVVNCRESCHKDRRNRSHDMEAIYFKEEGKGKEGKKEAPKKTG